MMLNTLIAAMILSAPTFVKQRLATDIATCGACVLADHVWCYHDGICYAHGDKADAQPFSCPGTDNCAASDCDCHTCAEAQCKPKVPNAPSCSGWTCSVQGQYCPPQLAGSSGNGYCCTDNHWIAGVCEEPNPHPITQVEQVHISYGLTNTSMVVAWASGSGGSAAPVTWGPVGGPMVPAPEADTRALNLSGSGSRYTHQTTIEGLVDGGRYNYTVGDRQFGFHFLRAKVASRASRHIIFGDLGATHGFSLCDKCTASDAVCDATTCASADGTKGLISELDADMFLHLGDFAYNFDSDGGFLGDQFMRNIEQVAARVPYMVTHGNHEDSGANLAHYVERFRNMPSNAVPPTFATIAGACPTNNMYFSWDAGLVHYISLSTEFWFGVQSADGAVKTAEQLAWLEKDLAAANANRANVPWIIAQGHRDIYCSTSDDSDCNAPGQAGTVRNDLEPLFFKHGLDLWLNGHEHSYERTYPLYEGMSEKCPGVCPPGPAGAQGRNSCVETCTNPNATIYIVTGAAGSAEMHEGFDNKQPSWSAYRSNTFGYSRLIVHNHTHINWQQVQTDPTLFPLADYGAVIDDMWVVQEHHGPFNPDTAPKGTAWPVGDESPQRSDDHWAPLLDLGNDNGNGNGNDGRATSALIREYIATHGEAAWAEKEDNLIRYANSFLGGKAEWEDVREDGGSSGAWFRWKNQPVEEVVEIMRRR